MCGVGLDVYLSFIPRLLVNASAVTLCVFAWLRCLVALPFSLVPGHNSPQIFLLISYWPFVLISYCFVCTLSICLCASPLSLFPLLLLNPSYLFVPHFRLLYPLTPGQDWWIILYWIRIRNNLNPHKLVSTLSWSSRLWLWSLVFVWIVIVYVCSWTSY